MPPLPLLALVFVPQVPLCLALPLDAVFYHGIIRPPLVLTIGLDLRRWTQPLYRLFRFILSVDAGFDHPVVPAPLLTAPLPNFWGDRRQCGLKSSPPPLLWCLQVNSRTPSAWPHRPDTVVPGNRSPGQIESKCCQIAKILLAKSPSDNNFSPVHPFILQPFTFGTSFIHSRVKRSLFSAGRRQTPAIITC